MTNTDNINKDKNSALTAVRDNYKAYKFLTAENKSIKAIALVAVTLKYKAFKWVPEGLRKDKEIALAALRGSHKALKWIPNELLIDDDILKKALDYGGDYYEGLINMGIFNEAAQAYKVIKQFSEHELIQNKAMVKKLIKMNDNVYKELPEIVKEDKELTIFAVQQVKPELLFSHIPDKLMVDMDVLIAAVRAFPSTIASYSIRNLLTPNEESFYCSGGALSFIKSNHHFYNNKHKIDERLLLKLAVENDPLKDKLLNPKPEFAYRKVTDWI